MNDQGEKGGNRAGMSMLAASMLIFGTIGLFRRLVPLSSGLIACFRGLAGAAFLVLFVRLKGRKLLQPLAAKKLLLLLLSGALIGVNWILLFEAYNYTTVPTATLCYYMAPTLVILASAPVLHERLTLRRGLCALAALIGMVLVSGAAENGLPEAKELTGILLALGAAVLYCCVVLLNKLLDGVDSYERTALQLGSAGIAILPYVLLTENFSALTLTPGTAAILLLMGIVHTGLSYTLYFSGISRLSAGTASMLSYIDPVTALIVSALFLHETLTPLGIAGAVLILGAAALAERGSRETEKQN